MTTPINAILSNAIIAKGNKINKQDAKLALRAFDKRGLKIITIRHNEEKDIIVRLIDKKTKTYVWIQNNRNLENLIGKGKTKILAILDLVKNIKGQKLRKDLVSSQVFRFDNIL